MADIRPNRIKQKLAQGQAVTILGGLNNAEVVEAMGPLGFDGAWIECEHGPITWEQVANMSRACDLWGMTSVCRVNNNEPWLITRTLDVGAQGIVVPHVNNLAEARQAAQSAKYNMDNNNGYRGMGGGRQSFGVTNYHRKANEESLVIVLIEESQAVDNLPEILTVDGIDVFMVVPGDLAQSMGHTGQPSHPDVQATLRRGIAQVVAAGKHTGSTASEDNVADLYNIGARLFLTSWQPWIARGASQYLSKVNALA